jgi:glycosyltransferase involved in cell wall biosynthesis
MNFTIILPTYNRNFAVTKLLSELEPCKDQLEIIILDDSDIIDPHNTLTYPDWVIVNRHFGKRGAINCLNLGIDKSTNNHILVLGDDTHIHNIKEFLKILEIGFLYGNEKPPIIGFKLIDKSPKHIPTILTEIAWYIFGLPFPETGDNYKLANFTGTFAFIKSSIRFDPKFLGSGFNAETDFQLQHKSKLWYMPGLEVYHDEINESIPHKNDKLKLHNHGVLLRKHSHFWLPKQIFYHIWLLL